MWKCPECDAEIENIRYNVNTSGWEVGYAPLSSENEQNPADRTEQFDYDDSGQEWSDTPTYECPSCEREIELRNLLWKPELDLNPSQKPEEDPEETTHDIITPVDNISCREPSQTLESGIICKTCKLHFPIDDDDEETHCPECGTFNSTEEFKELLEEGFYNKTKP